jgi:hypothetical protein
LSPHIKLQLRLALPTSTHTSFLVCYNISPHFRKNPVHLSKDDKQIEQDKNKKLTNKLPPAGTGNQAAGRPACKSPEQQLQEFESAIAGAGMQIGTRWFDIEPGGGPCNAWNLGSSANLALAQQWVQLLKQSGNNWGIYANGNEWTRMFASRSTDIGASDLPLWAVQADGKPGVSTVHTFMAGWTSASAKQYKEGEFVLLFFFFFRY